MKLKPTEIKKLISFAENKINLYEINRYAIEFLKSLCVTPATINLIDFTNKKQVACIAKSIQKIHSEYTAAKFKRICKQIYVLDEITQKKYKAFPKALKFISPSPYE